MPKTHTIKYRVFLDDIDYWGVVSHHKWIAIMERLRTEILAEPYKELLSKGFALVVANLEIKYKRTVRFDERLTFEITARPHRRNSMYVRHVAKKENGEIAADADVHLVFVNQKGRPIPMPEGARKSFLGEDAPL